MKKITKIFINNQFNILKNILKKIYFPRDYTFLEYSHTLFALVSKYLYINNDNIHIGFKYTGIWFKIDVLVVSYGYEDRYEKVHDRYALTITKNNDDSYTSLLEYRNQEIYTKKSNNKHLLKNIIIKLIDKFLEEINNRERINE